MYKTLFIILSPAILVNAQTSLNYGTFAAGYKQEILTDFARPGIPVGAWRGALDKSVVSSYRKIPVNIWYPAVAKGNVMRYGDFLSHTPESITVNTREEKLAKGKARWIEQTNDLGAKNKFSLLQFDSVFTLNTRSYLNASVAKGRFPVVVIPELPLTNSILAEYLASHGFVVAALPMMGTESTAPENTVRGLETSAMDILEVISFLNQQSYVRENTIGLLGTGFNSSNCVVARTRNPNIKAIVSLEGGTITNFEDGLLQQTPFFDPRALAIPLMLIYAPHPHVKPHTIDYYKYTTIYYRYFANMREFDFLNYGIFNTTLPGIIGATNETSKDFEKAANEVLTFFTAWLKNDHASRDKLNTPDPVLVEEEFKPGIRQAIPLPPTIEECKDMFHREGIEKVVTQYYQLKKYDPQPFTQNFFRTFTGWLGFLGVDNSGAQLAVSKLRVDAYPQSSVAWFNLGRYAARVEDADLAKGAYQKALELLPLDKDPMLSDDVRLTIQTQSETYLNQ